MLDLMKVDILPQFDAEVSKRLEIYSSLGQLSEVLFQKDLGITAALSFSGAMFLHEGGRSNQRSKVGDFDVFVDDIRKTYQLITANQKILGLEDIRVGYGEVPPLFGTPETRHIGCTFKPAGGLRRDLDIYSNFDPKSGRVIGMQQEITYAKDVRWMEFDYPVGGVLRHTAVPVFKTHALLAQYWHLKWMQQRYADIIKNKPRDQSVVIADKLSLLDMDWCIPKDRLMPSVFKEEILRKYLH